jgi:hypothetical protein
LKAEPFVPFTILMPSGRTHEVRDPQDAWASRHCRLAFISKCNGSASVIDLRLVESLDFAAGDASGKVLA